VVKTNKLKTWQEAAQQIAHEIKNPLTPIQLATQRMQRKYGQTLSSDPLFVQSTQTILDQVKIIQDLVNHFSAFASMPKLSLEQTNIGDLIGDIIGFYTLSYQDITFLAYVDSSLTVVTDKKKLTRAIVNILDNSIQALATIHLDDKQKWISITAQPSFDMQALLITIIDNGPGIAPEIRDKLFLPYVSSGKKNMGLGLAIVQDIMQQLGGSVSVVPQKHGAGFRLTVPLTQP
jgi:two-component system nitrogen regulation sensor histidine kinase NtrY